MQKAAAQQDAWAQRSVWCCFEGKVASMSFFLLYQTFPLFPHARENFGMSWKKLFQGGVWQQVPDCWAGAGMEGRAGMAGLAGMRQGPGLAWGGGGTCMFLHKTCIGIG